MGCGSEQGLSAIVPATTACPVDMCPEMEETNEARQRVPWFSLAGVIAQHAFSLIRFVVRTG